MFVLEKQEILYHIITRNYYENEINGLYVMCNKIFQGYLDQQDIVGKNVYSGTEPSWFRRFNLNKTLII